MTSCWVAPFSHLVSIVAFSAVDLSRILLGFPFIPLGFPCSFDQLLAGQAILVAPLTLLVIMVIMTF